MEQHRDATNSGWYLIAEPGDLVVGVHPGMPLGETAAGVLSFDPQCAQLALDVADDGDLLLSAAANHEFESADGTRCRDDRVARQRRAKIYLANNVLRLDSSFTDPAQADDPIKIYPVAASPTTAESTSEPQTGWELRQALLRDIADAAARAQPPRSGTSRRSDTAPQSTASRPSHRSRPSSQPRLLAPWMGLLLAAAVSVGGALTYFGINQDSSFQPGTDIGPGTPLPAERPQAPSALPEDPPPSADTLSADVAPPPAPEPQREPETTPAIEPIATPAIARRPVPQPAPDQAATDTAEPSDVAGAPEGTPAPPQPRPPDPALVARLEETGTALQSTTAQLASQRDLIAADLRQTLINRTMAQLAGGALQAARTSLQAAADAGADPQLIANLRGEIEYQQQRNGDRRQRP